MKQDEAFILSFLHQSRQVGGQTHGDLDRVIEVSGDGLGEPGDEKMAGYPEKSCAVSGEVSPSRGSARC